MNIEYKSTVSPEDFWSLMDVLDHETTYMLYEPGERKKDLDRMKSVIQAAADGNAFLQTAVCNGETVGYLYASREQLTRVRHIAYIVIGIRDGFKRQGIGTEFFQRMEAWAREKGIIRLELTVQCANILGIQLYEKQGFVIEGTKKKAMLVGGEYIDEYYMAKILS